MKVHIVEINNSSKNINYITEYEKGEAFLVDSSDNKKIKKFLKEKNLNLTHIFLTHSHTDHIQGINELLKFYKCKLIDYRQKEEEITFNKKIKVKITDTKGHSEDSISLILYENRKQKAVFSGDTLYDFGCGSAFYSTKELYLSLQKLKKLDKKTTIYPGHNYTQENIKFALSVCQDKKLISKLKKVKIQKKYKPTTIKQEREHNIFLRAKSFNDFKKLRELEDNF